MISAYPRDERHESSNNEISSFAFEKTISCIANIEMVSLQCVSFHVFSNDLRNENALPQ